MVSEKKWSTTVWKEKIENNLIINFESLKKNK